MTCRECGLTQQVLTLNTFNVNSAPIHTGYNRSHRFSLKVNKLIGLHSGPSIKDPVWEYLHKNELGLNTPYDVRCCLRASKLINKHYDSMRQFCDTFTPFRVCINPMELKKDLLKKFELVAVRWHQHFFKGFFSYAWLMRHFLEEVGSPLVAYLKPQTCKRRHEKYEAMLKLILSRKTGCVLLCDKQGDHPQNAKSHRDSRPYVLHQLRGPVLVSPQEYDGHLKNLAAPPLYLEHMNPKTWDHNVS